MAKLRQKTAFYGGIVRDQRSKEVGAALNIEELDILENADFIRPAQIFSSDTLPASTEAYAFDAGDDDTMYAYGKETGAGKVRLLSLDDGGADNPGAWSTLFTSADATDLATTVSPLTFFRSNESSNNTYLLYITGASTTWKLTSYNLGTSSETDEGTLTGLDGSFMRPTMKIIFGDVYICHGQYIATFDSDGAFTEKAFTLPKEWEAVDIIPASDVAIILARNKNRKKNETRGFWWDLTRTTQFDDSFTIPFGGPQWITAFKEKALIFCSINGVGKWFLLPGLFAGATPVEVPNMLLENVAAETSLQPASSPKMLSIKDKVIYFAVNKTDKTGIYGIGQLDSNKPLALYMAKRYATTDYSNHSPTAFLTQGPNFYGAFDDNGTAKAVRCESNNSPARSSNAVWESTWQDEDTPMSEGLLQKVYVQTHPLAASTAVTVSARADHASSYTALTEADGGTMNSTGDELAVHLGSKIGKGYAFQVKLAFTSNNTDAPHLVALGLQTEKGDLPSK